LSTLHGGIIDKVTYSFTLQKESYRQREKEGERHLATPCLLIIPPWSTVCYLSIVCNYSLISPFTHVPCLQSHTHTHVHNS